MALRSVLRPGTLPRWRSPATHDPATLLSSFSSSFNNRSQARLWHISTPFRIRPTSRPLKAPRVRRYASQRPTPDVTTQLGSPESKLGLQARLKKLFKQYGYLSVGVYLFLSAADFPFCFLAVRLAGPERIGQIEHQILSTLKSWTTPIWDVIEPVAGPAVHAIGDTVSRIRHGAANTAGLGASAESVHEGPHKSESASIWTQLAIAYGIHKTVLIFVRVPLTAVLTPKIARVLQSYGWKVGKAAS